MKRSSSRLILNQVKSLHSDYVELKIAKASEIAGQNFPQAAACFDLSGSNLPQYVMSKYCMEEEREKSVKTHSYDSNSENAEGNDYGNTPDSSKGSSRSDEDSEAFEGEDDKTKRLLRLMEKNEQSDSENEGYSDDDYDDGFEYQRKKRKTKKRYVDVAHDAWYNRDDDEGDY